MVQVNHNGAISVKLSFSVREPMPVALCARAEGNREQDGGECDEDLVFIGVFILSCDVGRQNPSKKWKNLCRK